jgi:hypothetical protein
MVREAGGLSLAAECSLMFVTQLAQIVRWALTWTFILSVWNSNLIAVGPLTEVSAALPSSGSIVIGFVGGFVRHNNTIHQEVRLATHLSNEYPAGMQARIFENRQGRQAHEAILQLLDTNRDRTLTDAEKGTAHIVLYGHSWGASEAVTLARALEKDGIPVLLTIQVDSVSKFGEDDRLIPANVAEAVNFYQLDGLLHGRRQILAADRRRTQILGNFQLDYKTRSIKCAGFPWYAQVFMKPHIEIESDPSVWNRVEDLIRSKLPPAAPNTGHIAAQIR